MRTMKPPHLCLCCGKLITLRNNGKFKKHKDPKTGVICEGYFRTPERQRGKETWQQEVADSCTPQDMAAVAALRKRLEKACAHCGAAFTAIKTARYCSNACRQRAKRERAKKTTQKR